MEIINHDIRGQLCPSSLLLTLKELNKYKDKIKSGTACIKIKTDNRDAITTIPGAAEMMGFSVKIDKEDDATYIISIEKV
ncbi:MAG: sulfurtransferase TusA family protein [Thermodesulfovibrionales bacterium]|nr:sulfurtransferase TusA family protein [Thermodesulfovibrionales bacterium]